MIVARAPLPRSINVPEDTLVGVKFYDADLDLDPSSVIIKIDGVTVYTGVGGFAAGYVGITYDTAGVHTVQFTKLGGWGYNTTVTVYAFVADATVPVPLTAQDTWDWTTRDNPLCYTGLTPLPIELKLQQPMQQFLELEPLRATFIDVALKLQPAATKQRNNKAARVIYQYGFSTELNTLLNPYRLRDRDALNSTVCERENVMIIDAALSKFKDRTQAGIQSLLTLGALPREYIAGLVDYQDSTLPSYRVSLAANLLMFARSVEDPTSPTLATPDSIFTEDGVPLLTEQDDMLLRENP